MVGIYKIYNTKNNKIYIGQSVNIKRRWTQHINKIGIDNSPLHNAMGYYGVDNFTFEVVEECLVEDLDTKEKYWIEFYNSIIPNGYNVSYGGQRDKGAVFAHFNKDEIDDIVNKLQNHFELTINEIAEDYGVRFQTISDINTGRSYFNNKLIYPLRERYASQRKEYVCEICGTPIYKGSTRCVSCAAQAQRVVTNRPSPKDLAQQIVADGFEGTGRRYGVSGNAIKKWCKSYGMPHLKNELKEWLNNQ